MRLALVVLFIAALFVFIRPIPPIDRDPRIAETPSPQPAPVSPPPVVADAPATGVTSAAPPGETADDATSELPGVRSGESERAGEQRTSQRGTLKRTEVEAQMQTELLRMACLTGRAERQWGAKARAALRRFTDRARPKEGGAPTEALLNTMRSYPANYCRLCNPGQAACKLRGAPPQRRSDASPQRG